MKKLNTILNSNKIYIILSVCLIIYIIININLHNKSTIAPQTEELTSKVIDYTLTPNSLNLIINNKETLIAKYKIKNENEYNYLKENIKYGTTIKTKGKLIEPNSNTTPYTFNYKAYLNNKNIFYIQNINSIEIINKPTVIIDKIKNTWIERINIIDNTGFLKAFVLGDKSNIENYEKFKEIGVTHLFALSGMHIALISNIILIIFHNKHKIIIQLLILYFYDYILAFPTSITRTIVYLTIDKILDYTNIAISNTKKLFLTASILVVFKYNIIFDISFYYSFIIIYGIYKCNNFIKSKNRIISSIKLSVVTFIYSLPITLHYFYQINLLSILYNLFYIPFISLIVYPLSLLSFIIPILIHPLKITINIIFFITNILSNINIFKLYLSFNVLETIIYYIVLTVIIKLKKHKLIFIPLLMIPIVAAIPYLDNSSHVIFFDVSQGDSSLIITPHRKKIILIDTGGKEGYEISKNIITYLKHEGIDHINILILTHGDFDHMGEAINLVNNFKVEKVIFNCGEFNDLEKELIKVLDKKKIKYYSCIKELNINKNKLYFLQTKEYDNENDNSNVIYTEINGYKFMFMGDASITTEKEIMNKYNLPDIDVLKVGHHGSKTSSSKEFISEINPRYSIISVGKNNRYGHPNKETLDNLENTKIYRTDQDGSIMFKIENNKLKIETCAP